MSEDNSKPLGYTYHSHTKRCGHAVGEDEDYAKKAIEGHYDLLGYSDHVMLPGYPQPGMRGDFSLAEGYFKSVRDLQRKYEKQLQIYLAFEAEWYGDLFHSYYYNLLEKKTIDYLLLGQHDFISSDGKIIFYGNVLDKKMATQKYTDDLIAGMESGLFLYVAHPDLFMSWYPEWDSFAYSCATRIIETAKSLDMVLEVNMGPSRWGRRNKPGEPLNVPYPCPEFWDLVSEAGVRTIVGVDSHDPKELLTSDFAWVRKFVEEHNLRYQERMPLPFTLKR